MSAPSTSKSQALAGSNPATAEAQTQVKDEVPDTYEYLLAILTAGGHKEDLLDLLPFSQVVWGKQDDYPIASEDKLLLGKLKRDSATSVWIYMYPSGKGGHPSISIACWKLGKYVRHLAIDQVLPEVDPDEPFRHAVSSTYRVAALAKYYYIKKGLPMIAPEKRNSRFTEHIIEMCKEIQTASQVSSSSGSESSGAKETDVSSAEQTDMDGPTLVEASLGLPKVEPGLASADRNSASEALLRSGTMQPETIDLTDASFDTEKTFDQKATVNQILKLQDAENNLGSAIGQTHMTMEETMEQIRVIEERYNTLVREKKEKQQQRMQVTQTITRVRSELSSDQLAEVYRAVGFEEAKRQKTNH